jgi:hypothetical protein
MEVALVETGGGITTVTEEIPAEEETLPEEAGATALVVGGVNVITLEVTFPTGQLVTVGAQDVMV